MHLVIWVEVRKVTCVEDVIVGPMDIVPLSRLVDHQAVASGLRVGEGLALCLS